MKKQKPTDNLPDDLSEEEKREAQKPVTKEARRYVTPKREEHFVEGYTRWEGGPKPEALVEIPEEEISGEEYSELERIIRYLEELAKLDRKIDKTPPDDDKMDDLKARLLKLKEDHPKDFQMILENTYPYFIEKDWPSLTSFEDESQEAPPVAQEVTLGQEETKISNYAFLQTGPAWDIVFDGRPLRGLKGKGFAYMHHCMKNPEKVFSNDELYTLVAGKSEPPPEIKGQELRTDSLSRKDNQTADRKAIKNIKEHISYLRSEFDKAKEANDGDRANKLRKEFEDCEENLLSDIYKGHIKTFKNGKYSTSMAVSRAIDRAIKQLLTYDEEAHKHFTETFKYPYSPTKQYRFTKALPWKFE